MEESDKLDNPKKACIYMVIPTIKEMEYSYLSDGIYSYLLEPPFTIPQMPPHSTLEMVYENLKLQACKSVQFPFGVLDLEGVKYLLYLHEMKVQQESFFAEESWFDVLGNSSESGSLVEKKGKKLVWAENRAPLPPVLRPPNADVLLKFKETITTLKEDDILPLSPPPDTKTVDLTIKEAATLACSQHFAERVMVRFIDILMARQQETFVGYLSNVNDVKQLGQDTRDKYGSDLKRFIFVLNVSCEYGSAQLASADVQGNHYSFCVIEVTDENVKAQYFDTLRCPFPTTVKNDHIPSFLCGYFSDVLLEQVKITNTTLQDSSQYPMQNGIDTVCGPATIVGVSLAVLMPELFNKLALSKSLRKNSRRTIPELECLSHLLFTNIEHASKLLRFSIIEWLYNANIDLDNVLKSNEVITSPKKRSVTSVKNKRGKRGLSSQREVTRREVVKRETVKREPVPIEPEWDPDPVEPEWDPDPDPADSDFDPDSVEPEWVPGKPKRGSSKRGRGVGCRGRGVGSRGRGTSSRGRGTSSRGRGTSTRGRGRVKREEGTIGQARGTVIRERGTRKRKPRIIREEDAKTFANFEIHKKRKYVVQAPEIVLKVMKKGCPFARLKQRNSRLKPYFQLHCVLKKNFQLKAKNFSICASDEAPEYPKTIKTINAFLDTEECLEWLEIPKSTEEIDDGMPNTSHVEKVTELFAKPYKTRFIKPSSLSLIMYLKGGIVVYRNFPCKDETLSDPSTQKIIDDYLDSTEALNLALVKLSGENDWDEVCELPVGLQTKWYFDDFKFDIKKETKMERKFVKPVYHEGESTLMVALAQNQRWGRTHRFDETYEYTDDTNPPSTRFPVVTLHISCASKSTACKSACGDFLCKMEIGKVGSICPSCRSPLTDEEKPMSCEHCSVIKSSTWMIVEEKNVCHTCYRYHRKHGYFRPESLLRKPPKHKISYHSHLRCRWKMKLVLYSTDLKNWKVFALKSNSTSHSTEAIQHNKRPSLSTRDEWDYQRVFNNATPCKMYPTETQGNSVHVPFTQKQYTNRINVIKNKLKTSIKRTDENPINSSWRDTEKILESKLDNVILFHRGDEVSERDYMILLSNDHLSKGLRDFGNNILCYDTRHNIMANEFSISLLTYADANNKGRSALLSICSKESKIAHCKTIQIAIANIPCDDENCSHERQLYILNDRSGFFFIRPCAQEKQFNPVLQHDMNLSARRAAMELGFQTALSQFHSLEAYRKHISDSESPLKLFLRPLETAFKCILRSWNPQSRHHTISRFVDFVNDVIPHQLLPMTIKARFQAYLSSQWFSQDWMSTFTAEVIYGTNQKERRDLYLLLTNRMTDQKFRDIGGCVLGGHADKLMSTFVGLTINKFMNTEGRESETARSKWTGSRTMHSLQDSDEMNRIKLGCQIAKDTKIVVAEGGWMIVAKGMNLVEKLDSNNISEKYFMESCDGELMNEVADKMDTYLTPSSNIAAMSQEIIHTDTKEILTASKSLLHELDQTAAGIFLSAVLHSIPEHTKTRYQINQGYLCNLEIGICTCYAFIIHGQPHFCKHLYACFAVRENTHDPSTLLERYNDYVPTYEFEGMPSAVSTAQDPFYLINALLHQSHLASYAELEDAVRNGKILSLLHDCYSPLVIKSGVPNKGGRPKKKVLPPDPYRPLVASSAYTKEAQSVRKRSLHPQQDSDFQELVLKALDDLGVKRTKYDWVNTSTINNDDHHFDISDFIDTFAEVQEPMNKPDNEARRIKKKPRPKPVEEAPLTMHIPAPAHVPVHIPVNIPAPAHVPPPVPPPAHPPAPPVLPPPPPPVPTQAPVPAPPPANVVPMLCSHCATTNNPFAVFYSEKELQDHIKQCHIQPITCPWCYRMRHIIHTFSSKQEYIQHCNLFHEVNPT